MIKPFLCSLAVMAFIPVASCSPVEQTSAQNEVTAKNRNSAEEQTSAQNETTAESEKVLIEETNMKSDHSYIGMWVTGDGHIRQELLSNGRYDEARGDQRSAYVGRYEIDGNYIRYWDDTGFTADGTFVDLNTLEHGGYIFYREQ